MKVNHSCVPNSRLQEIGTGTKTIVCFVANEDMMAGTEVKTNYKYAQKKSGDHVNKRQFNNFARRKAPRTFYCKQLKESCLHLTCLKYVKEEKFLNSIFIGDE